MHPQFPSELVMDPWDPCSTLWEPLV